ncbi:MAG: HD domain-containing protein [Fervidicoccaceae archaeon]|jgi:uncharacterized protein|uniref:HD domain-containing protein n=1 Tax=Fervidicoccus fontis TaxID=683846 RepID=A0A7C2UUZ3_9CREN|nr:MAG: phosphohydrolase [Fervidicoccus sp.]HEU98103.1 HD domain-containing protein [Fervidicoccus fontis]
MIERMSEEERRIVEKIENIARKLYPPFGTHGWDHVQRVCNLSIEIAEKEKEAIEEFPLLLSCLLHDIARVKEGGDHALESSKVAKELLICLNVKDEVIGKVVDAISSHSYSAGRIPTTPEGRVLSDADKIDALGAIGVARVFEYSGANGRSLDESIAHFRDKILKLPELMLTEEGRKIARERALFVEEFLRKLEAEIRETAK